MRTVAVTDPRSGRAVDRLEAADTATVQDVAARLRSAQSGWQQGGLGARTQCLVHWREELILRSETIVEALSADTGRRLLCHLEIQKTLELIDHWIERAPHILSDGGTGRSRMSPSVTWRHVNVPYPLVGVVSPWNFPLTLAVLDAVPALLAGSAVLLKPSEVTPRFVEPLCESIRAVEGLHSVFDAVVGDAGTGVDLVDAADAVCFTGSVVTGRKVALQAARNLTPAFLELGGKDPAIVTATADLDNAVRAIARSAFGATGQACQSLERAYVAHEVFDDFLERLVQAANGIRLNRRRIDRGHLGPLILPGLAERIRRQLDDARAGGARIHCGGRIEDRGGGQWCRPTVLTGVRPDMLVMREETFGPVIAVTPTASSREAIERANDSDYGLSGAVFSGTAAEAEAIAVQLEVGAVSINDAGLTAIVNDVEKHSFKCSGMGGSRMGDDGMRRFMRKRALLFQTARATSIDVLRETQAE